MNSRSPAIETAIPGVTFFEEALPGSLFERLARAIRAVGRERIKRNYTTTFWLPLGQKPTNVAEEAALALFGLAEPGSDCAGIEWWLGRLEPGQKLRYHFDRDMTLRRQTGEFVHPIRASVFYINSFPSSPTVILDQVAGPDGDTRIPEKPERRASIEAVANRYSIFPGSLRHGVMPVSELAPPGEDLRLSFLVNYWGRRPLPPLCFDYDGSIYPELREVG